jgi:hypothetical protein
MKGMSEVIEREIDSTSLADVLDAIIRICLTRAEHLNNRCRVSDDARAWVSTTVSKKLGFSWGTLAVSAYAQPRERPRPAVPCIR